MPAHLSLGRAGEEAAAKHLKKAGYKVLERNWSKNRLELDLICRLGKIIVFVEVKTRSGGSLGSPADALTPAKMSRLVRGAALYLSETDQWERSCRFDLVSVTGTGDDLVVEHVENAFTMDDAGPATGFWQP